MKNKKIYILYNTIDNLDQSHTEVVQLFSNVENLVENEICQEFINQNFQSKEDLLASGYELTARLDADLIYFLLMDDFNIGIESCHNVSDILELFEKNAGLLELRSEDRQGIFNKLFGKLF